MNVCKLFTEYHEQSSFTDCNNNHTDFHEDGHGDSHYDDDSHSDHHDGGGSNHTDHD